MIKNIIQYLFYGSPVLGYLIGERLLRGFLDKIKFALSDKITADQAKAFFDINNIYVPVFSIFIGILFWCLISCVKTLYEHREKNVTKSSN